MADRIQTRRDTLANWTKANPILLDGEVVLVATDETKPYVYDSKKVGDGTHAFNDLEMLGYECLQELGDSTMFPVSQKVTNKLYIKTLNNMPFVDRGIYFGSDGVLRTYSKSRLVLFLLPTLPCIFYSLWDSSNDGTGITFLSSDLRAVGYLHTSNGAGLSFVYNPEEIEIPEGAEYIAVHTQWNSFRVESDEPLFTVPFSVKKIINETNRELFKTPFLEINDIKLRNAVKELYIDGNITQDMLPLSIYLFNNGDLAAKGFYLHDVNKNLIFSSEALVNGYNEIFNYNQTGINVRCIIDFSNVPKWSNIKYNNKVLSTAFNIDYSPTIKLINFKNNLLTLETRKNKFDKNSIINGFYIDTTTGRLTREKDSAISNLIPVIPNEVYHLERPNSIESELITHELRFLKKDKSTIVKPLKENGTEFTSFNIGKVKNVRVPEDCFYCQFTIKFNGGQCDYNKVQFELGNVATEYEPFYGRNIIDYSLLPRDLNGLSKRVDNLEKDFDIITIANSDKIGFFSNSFLNGYCMLGKHAINNLSMYSDYIMYNYGHSGDDLLELLARVDRNEKWLGDVPVQEWGIKYGVIAMQDNDGALFAASSDTYYENGKKLANAIKAMGGIPILSTEHDWNKYYYNFARLAQEQNLMFMNWGETASKLDCRFSPFWHNNHPATRTAWLWSYGMQNYFNTLPRPEKAIKLFRARPSVNTSNIENLMYEDIFSRAERFEEIGCGVSTLTEETEKYFDRLDTNLQKYVSFKDEYQKLQAKTSTVEFSKCCLIELITPYDINGIKGATLKITATGVTSVFIRKIISLSNPLPATRYVAFGIETGTLNVGQSFEITGGVFNDNIKGIYTVMGVVNGIVVTTTSSSGKTTSGTDTPITNVSGVTLKGSYDYPSSDYIQRYNKPLGEWIEVTMSENGEIILDDYLTTSMDFDKLSVLLVGENISLSDVIGMVKGTFKKENTNKTLSLFPKKGISLLTDTLFMDESSWHGIENLEVYSPVKANSSEQTEKFPSGITAVRIMSKGQSIQQKLNIANMETFGYGFKTLQIRIVARYFPEYVNSDSKWETSSIKRGTYDCVKLAIKFAASQNDTNPVKVGVIHVGAWWNEFIIETPYYTGDFIVLEAEDSNIQIARCEVIQVN